MVIDSSIYTHDLDRSALQALQALPGFTPALKAFMKVWDEKLYQIENMSSNLRLGDTQMKKYCDMLPPICEKLGIEVPDLYLKQSGSVNAYTSGDTKPFIVMHTGLLKALPEELIPTVLAHECGHIACHHVLYRTMGTMILNGAFELLNVYGLSNLVSYPLKSAFYHWMRCSEYSADRAAMICDGSADKLMQLCMYFAGYDKSIKAEPNIDAFMSQAKEYKALMDGSKWNKTLELLMFSDNDHPLSAVRAYESQQWQNTDVFSKIIRYVNSETPYMEEFGAIELPMTESSSHYIGKECESVQNAMQNLGFMNIETTRAVTHPQPAKPEHVVALSIGDNTTFARGDWFCADAPVVITYYRPPTEEEIAAAHPGEIKIPNTSKYYIGRNYQVVAQEFAEAGFTRIILEEQKVRKTWLTTENTINKITIDGQSQFEKDSWFQPDTEIRILYQTFLPQ